MIISRIQSKYDKVSLIIDEIAPLQERLKFDAFNDVEFWMNKAYECSILNQLNAAVDFYKHGLKVDNLNPVVYYNIGAVFSQRNEWNKAIEWFSKVGEILSDLPFDRLLKTRSRDFMSYAFTINTALMYYRLRDYQKALLVISKCKFNTEETERQEDGIDSRGT